MKTTTILMAAAIGLFSVACNKEGCTDETALNYNKKAKKDDGTCNYATKSYQENLKNIGENVITETYVELATESANLHAEINILVNTPSFSQLDIVRNAWRDTRAPWELSESFLFGPVDTKGIDPAIDSWPVNVIDLDNVLNSTDQLTEAYVSGLIGELKGFHTIEYLLWGEDGNKELADFTAREYEYLIASSADLKTKTETLSNSWIASGENYVANISNAGTSASIYQSEKSVLEELTNGLIGIADEVRNGKINDPLSQQDLTLEESRFSHNSKNDFSNNIRSISNIYNGKFNIAGLGIYDIIYEINAELADRFNTEINEAITAIESIPNTFTDAIINNTTAVENARDKVGVIQTTLESEILPIITNL